MKPLMRKREIKIIENEILRLSKNETKLEILEWGSGGSTIYFTEYMDKHKIDYSWISIEYNRRWYNNVKKNIELNTKVKMVLVDVGNDVLKQRYVNMEEYIKYPLKEKKKFDLILIDGRKRRRCLIEARSIIKDNGVVILHDAQRRYYHCALSEYPNALFAGPYLWKGKLNHVGVTRKHINKMSYYFWLPKIFLESITMFILRKIYYSYLIKIIKIK